MKNKLFDKNKMLCLAAITVIILSYAVEKLLNIFTQQSKTQLSVVAIVMTVLLAVVALLIYKSKSAFMGLLASLIGYKMMPMSITGLNSLNTDVSMLYFIVRRFAVVLFVILIIRFFKMQKSYDKIKILPILAIMYSVTFAAGIANNTHSYFLTKTGSMLGVYFTGFVCYIIASLVILLVSYTSNYESMRFAAYFEFVALGINILRKVAAIAVHAVNSWHISASYYCWIVIYVVIIIAFYIAKQNKKKTLVDKEG